MSQVPPGHNLARRRGAGPRTALLLGAGAAWAATMALVVRSEVLVKRDARDVRELVASARLTRQHASAHYVIRAGDVVVGTLSSTVSGSREEEQLAYVVEGELHAPLTARLKGVVVATWDRRPERLVLDLDLGGTSHRVDGALSSDGSFRVRYVPPGGSPEDASTWELDAPPALAAGPLPIPELSGEGLSEARRGSVADPATGAPMSWALAAPVAETIVVASRSRRVRRHELSAGGARVTAWTDETGFPVRLDLPGGIVVELTGEGR